MPASSIASEELTMQATPVDHGADSAIDVETCVGVHTLSRLVYEQHLRS